MRQQLKLIVTHVSKLQRNYEELEMEDTHFSVLQR